MERPNFVSNGFGEEYLYEVDRDLFVLESASSRIDSEFRDSFQKPDSLHIIIGSDSGNIINYLQITDLPLGSRFVFIEPDFIKQLIKDKVTGNLPENNIWLVTPEEVDEVFNDIHFVEYCFLNSVQLHRSLSAEYGFLPEYRALYWKIESRLGKLKWDAVASISSESFIKNQLLNIADNQNSISKLHGILENSTAVVLAGGPSLDLHIDWVIRNRENLYIFAVSRISKRLLELGLTPDFILSCDPTEESYQISKEMLDFDENVVFVNEYHVAPKLLKQWPYNKFFTHDLFPWQTELNPAIAGFTEPSGPTITNLAVSTAAWLGAGKIILLGVDLCFTEDGHTHALGSKERAAGPRFDLSGLTVSTNQGKKAFTEPDFANAISTLSVTASKLRAMGIDILTLSAKAAKIDCVDYALSESISITRKAQFNLSDKVSSGRAHLDRARSELLNKLSEFRNLKREIENAIGIHQKMYDGSYVDEMKKNELELIDRRIIDTYPESFSFLKRVSLRGLLRMSNSIVKLDDLDSSDIKARLDIYYDSLNQGSSWLVELIEQSLECIARRMNEINPTEQDFCDLAQSWIDNDEAGRYRLPWVERVIPESIKESLRRAYEEEMNRDYLKQLAEIKKERSLQSIPSRIVQFYDCKDEKGLTQLANSLEEFDGGEQYLPLAYAYLYLSQENKAEALNVLIPVTENPDSPILEHSLVKLFSLCNDLGLQQCSLDALAALSCLNKRYLSKYADALAANNQLMDAINHEIEYLHYYKADDRSLSKLKKWYQALGVTNANELIEKLR